MLNITTEPLLDKAYQIVSTTSPTNINNTRQETKNQPEKLIL